MFSSRLLKNLDYTLLVSLVFLLILSFLMIYSSTFTKQVLEGKDAFFFVKKQSFALFIGILILLAMIWMDYLNLKHFAKPLYFIILFLLVLVLFWGSSAQGAQRWIDLGFINLQPSELSKLILIIVLANYFTLNEIRLDALNKIYFLFGIYLLLPFLLIFKQPDLGTAIVILLLFLGIILASSTTSPTLIFSFISPAISLILRPFFFFWIVYLVFLAYMLWKSNLSLSEKIFTLGLNIGIGLLEPYLWSMLKDYQKTRIISFLNPGQDPLGAGYHSFQSKIAIGSGGIFGKGLFKGTQTHLQFIPEQHTDFIFSVIGEELGFIGVCLFIFLYCVIIWRSIVIATQAKDNFGNLTALGIGIFFLIHLFINVGMTIGICPVVGVPLPLISYGGSSLVVCLCAIGILESIAIRRQKLIF